MYKKIKNQSAGQKTGCWFSEKSDNSAETFKVFQQKRNELIKQFVLSSRLYLWDNFFPKPTTKANCTP